MNLSGGSAPDTRNIGICLNRCRASWVDVDADVCSDMLLAAIRGALSPPHQDRVRVVENSAVGIPGQRHQESRSHTRRQIGANVAITTIAAHAVRRFVIRDSRVAVGMIARAASSLAPGRGGYWLRPTAAERSNARTSVSSQPCATTGRGYVAHAMSVGHGHIRACLGWIRVASRRVRMVRTSWRQPRA